MVHKISHKTSFEELQDWSQERRVVLERRRTKDSVARQSRRANGQLQLALANMQALDADRLCADYTVLVTDTAYPLEAIRQLYRDRCDCESGFDEFKNQWGLSGFTTQDINRHQTTARVGALVYHWRSWYCRAAHPNARLEAVTSRRLLRYICQHFAPTITSPMPQTALAK